MACKCTYKRLLVNDIYLRNLLREKEDMQITDVETPGFQIRYYHRSKMITFFFHYSIRFARKQYNMKLGTYPTLKLKEARTLAMDYKKLVLAGRDPVDEMKMAAIARVKKTRLVKDVIAEYYEKYTLVYKKKNSQISDEGLIRRHVNPLLGSKKLTELTLSHINDFYTEVATKVSFSSANHALALVRHFWNWCERAEYLPLNSNPCKLIQKGKVAKLNYTILDADGYRRFFAAIEQAKTHSNFNHNALRVIKLIALTGCRRSEISELEKDELDLDKNALRLKDSKTGARTVPIGAPAVAELKIALSKSKKKEQKLFPATMGKKLELRKPFAWVLAKAGLPIMRIHDLRHSFASIAANMGEDLSSVQQVLGHSTTQMTQAYTHLSESKGLSTANKVSSAIMH